MSVATIVRHLPYRSKLVLLRYVELSCFFIKMSMDNHF
jgi:hypothetical protein